MPTMQQEFTHVLQKLMLTSHCTTTYLPTHQQLNSGRTGEEGVHHEHTPHTFYWHPGHEHLFV